MEEGQAHIQLKKTDARLDAIIVGDPARIDQVAKFLTDVKNLKYNREFRSICGTYKGKELLVLSTGVGLLLRLKSFIILELRELSE